jgi:hypothetical protein
LPTNWGFSCGSDLVLVYEAAEHLLSADPVLGEVDLGWPGVSLGRPELPKGAVRPGGVVVGQVFGQYLAQVVLIDDQHAVEQLAAQRADHPLADGVRSGCPRRAGEDPSARCHEHGVEGLSELPGTVPDQGVDRSGAVAEVHQEVTRCLSCP